MLPADFAGRIIEKAKSLFDVAGAVALPDGDYLLVLGLESTSERNLDDFGHAGGGFQMYGFRKYARPRLNSLLNFIHACGFTAVPVGRYGYPLGGETNLKKLAVTAGLGARGKSTIILHPEFGPRLRLMAVRTNAPLQPFVSETDTPERENEICRTCSTCIDVCPTGVLEPYRMIDPVRCLSNITPKTEDGRSILCDECLRQCPA
ncbi:MAG: hypothetical protein IBX68_01550 [Dehalococcoidia bacterium]|nr:hypothetical protein [Dehalococcoidia bacterium]